MNDAVEAKKSKDRSPSFPYVNLERAIERARMFYLQEKRGVTPYSRAVLHWGYTEASSAALQTVAALKSYGLLLEPPSPGKGRQLQLSDLALRILLDQRPDSNERLECIRQAARSPAVAAAVYEKWPDELPADSTLNHHLVLERRFNEATAPSVIKILKENQQFAQLQEYPVASLPMETTQELVMETTDRQAFGGRGDVAPLLKALQSGSMMPRGSVAVGSMALTVTGEPRAGGHTEQIGSIDGENTVSLQFGSKPDADFYEWIAFYASKKAEKMRATAKPLLASRATQSTDGPGDGNEETQDA